jgi:hypothetical protein
MGIRGEKLAGWEMWHQVNSTDQGDTDEMLVDCVVSGLSLFGATSRPGQSRPAAETDSHSNDCAPYSTGRDGPTNSIAFSDQARGSVDDGARQA